MRGIFIGPFRVECDGDTVKNGDNDAEKYQTVRKKTEDLSNAEGIDFDLSIRRLTRHKIYKILSSPWPGLCKDNKSILLTGKNLTE